MRLSASASADPSRSRCTICPRSGNAVPIADCPTGFPALLEEETGNSPHSVELALECQSESDAVRRLPVRSASQSCFHVSRVAVVAVASTSASAHKAWLSSSSVASVPIAHAWAAVSLRVSNMQLNRSACHVAPFGCCLAYEPILDHLFSYGRTVSRYRDVRAWLASGCFSVSTLKLGRQRFPCSCRGRKRATRRSA